MAVCGLNSSSVSPMLSSVETEFGIRQQHPKRGNFIIILRTWMIMQEVSFCCVQA